MRYFITSMERLTVLPSDTKAEVEAAQDQQAAPEGEPDDVNRALQTLLGTLR